MRGRFNTTIFPPRPLGGLQSDRNCNVFGWGGSHSYPPNDTVSVLGPSNCNSSFPQIFCTVFDSTNANTCSARASSPIMCHVGGNLSSISGLMVSNCTERNDRVEMNFINIEPFIQWIEEVSAANNLVKVSSLLILSIVLLKL